MGPARGSPPTTRRSSSLLAATGKRVDLEHSSPPRPFGRGGFFAPVPGGICLPGSLKKRERAEPASPTRHPPRRHIPRGLLPMDARSSNDEDSAKDPRLP